MHCFDLSGESEASETTVSSFNPMLEFMSTHALSSEPINKNKTKEAASDVVEQKDDLRDLVTNSTGVGGGGVNHFEFVVEKIFTDYKNLFQKEYKNEKEHVKRKDIFRHNLRYNKIIQSLLFVNLHS